MRISFFLIGLLFLSSCKLSVPGVAVAQFSSEPTVNAVPPGQIDEASGMADSRSQPGNVWIHQDSGSPAELILLGYDGKVKGKLSVPNVTNRDWEELATGPGPKDGNYLYIGDIGDNNAQHAFSQIYRMPEPTNLQTPITQIERINFRYPDGPRDAEAMFVDPQTKDIYIITKREPNNVRLYRLAYPQNINEVSVAQAYGELPITFVTGAAISPDGSEIVVRTYTSISYWKRNADQSIADVLQNGNSRQLPYRVEPQGEAICFDKESKGYFTISEKANASSVSLYYYARK